MSKDASAKYYQNNKERLQKKARERYQSLSKELKDKKQQYGREIYNNLPKNEKQKLIECKKNIIKWKFIISFGKFGKKILEKYKKFFRVNLFCFLGLGVGK